MQSIWLVVALIEIFANKLIDNECIVDCFGAMLLMLVSELMYQFKHVNFIARYSGNAIVFLHSVYMAEIASANGDAYIYPGML